MLKILLRVVSNRWLFTFQINFNNDTEKISIYWFFSYV
jgi:hypothetical protein